MEVVYVRFKGCGIDVDGNAFSWCKLRDKYSEDLKKTLEEYSQNISPKPTIARCYDSHDDFVAEYTDFSKTLGDIISDHETNNGSLYVVYGHATYATVEGFDEKVPIYTCERLSDLKTKIENSYPYVSKVFDNYDKRFIYECLENNELHFKA
ncbi:hypothetical protein BX667DRAFT_508006 [Coemansia mojavensis]|nr:hypothetical protein BX667DRAFT_220638 [Coemansia mojavensis]KAI9472980.1 hypothetical protein BX667DRAFT_508006 [Coemansia mojavensis]